MRAAIVSLMILLGALPFLFGARPFAAPNAPAKPSAVEISPLMPGTADQWLDFVRTISGTLIGAGLAFGANLHLQRRARRLEQIGEANAAGATLALQYNAFKNFERRVREETALREQIAPTTPAWFYARPFLHHIRDDWVIDFSKLTFIFEVGDTDCFEKLHIAQATFNELLGYIERLNELCIVKQERFEAAGYVMHELTISPAEAQAIAGPRLIGQLEPVIAEIDRLCAVGAQRFIDASQALYRVIGRAHGRGIRIIRIVE